MIIAPSYGSGKPDLQGDSLYTHIALLPDKSGFKAGARKLDVSTFYRHIAPLEQKVKSISFNRKPMDLQNLATWANITQIARQSLGRVFMPDTCYK